MTTSSGIGLPSQEHLDVPVPSKESVGAPIVNSSMAISPDSVQPEMLEGSTITSSAKSEAVTSKATLDSKLLLRKLRQTIGMKENISAIVSTSTPFSEDRLKNALTLPSSFENAKNLPQEKIKQFNTNLPSYLRTYTSNLNAIIEMVTGKQERFKELEVQLAEAMENVENFMKQAKDDMTSEVAPLYEEYYGLDQEIPTLDAKLEALVSNLSTSISAWDKFTVEIIYGRENGQDVKRLYDTFHEPLKRVVPKHLSVPETSTPKNFEPCPVSEGNEGEKEDGAKKHTKKEPETTIKSALSAAFAQYSDKIGKKNSISVEEKIEECSSTVEEGGENRNRCEEAGS
ncbi:hypothetical protein Vadar_033679 [Vaccinium darrowii]|uniref:Uncharacterized protein n=1 Tax=Vaccinium darrowii TaxID=229202 RepID=A0ACB7XV76_9ERIC|nr:hypothetical protein Vadar_033679 [Vaccinium darrowii]